MDEKLKQQLKLLLNSCNLFDRGYLEETKKIAVTIRTLLHDTSSSHSLLGQIGLKNINYINSTYKKNEKSITPYLGLIKLLMYQNKSSYIPRFNSNENLGVLNFNDWWNQVVLTDSKGNSFTRKKLILDLANKLGGAHYDTNPSNSLLEFSKGETIGYNVIGEKGEILPFDTNPENPCVRQIAFELMLTFEALSNDFFSINHWNFNLSSHLSKFIVDFQTKNNVVFQIRDIGWFYFREQRANKTIRLDNISHNVFWLDVQAENIEYLIFSGISMWQNRKEKFPSLLYDNVTNEEKILIQYLKSVLYKGNTLVRLNESELNIETSLDYMFENKLIKFLNSLSNLEYNINNNLFKNLLIMYLKIEVALSVHDRRKIELKQLVVNKFPKAKSDCNKIIWILNGKKLNDKHDMILIMTELIELIKLKANISSV